MNESKTKLTTKGYISISLIIFIILLIVFPKLLYPIFRFFENL